MYVKKYCGGRVCVCTNILKYILCSCVVDCRKEERNAQGACYVCIVLNIRSTEYEVKEIYIIHK